MVITIAMLGIVVTFAEPGIDSLQMVGHYVENPPAILRWLLINNPFVLLSSIAAGVGIAAAVGMLRIKRAWRFSFILVTTVPLSIAITVALAGTPLRFITPLAWDSGAFT